VLNKFLNEMNMSAFSIDVLQQKNERAWEQMYDWLAPDIRSFVRRLGARDVDDVLGETMLQLVRDIGSVSGDITELRPWAFRIARNRVIDASRKIGRRVPEVPFPDGESDTTTIDDSLITVGLTSAGEVDLDELARALAILTSAQREVLWLRYALDTSLEDTAQIIGSTPDAVASMAHRALSRLRKAAK
jgi:RNA polymerase sigma-70 factor (ECF subfamily)